MSIFNVKNGFDPLFCLHVTFVEQKNLTYMFKAALLKCPDPKLIIDEMVKGDVNLIRQVEYDKKHNIIITLSFNAHLLCHI